MNKIWNWLCEHHELNWLRLTILYAPNSWALGPHLTWWKYPRCFVVGVSVGPFVWEVHFGR